MISIFQIFTIFGIVSSWAEKSLADGKVTLEEATSLIRNLALILAIPTEIEFLTPPLDSGSDDISDTQVPKPDIVLEPVKRRPPD